MELSPRLYHWLVRPKWYNNLYINKRLKSLFENIDFENKKVLDFGCGIGSNSPMFNPEGYVGIDTDIKRIQYASNKYPNYKFQVFKEEALPFLDNSIDYVLIVAVLHHISPKMRSNYLKEFKRVLKPTGEIIVIEPCLFRKSIISNWYMLTFDKGKYICNEKEYLKVFREENYKIKKINKFKKCFIYNEIFFTANL